MMKPSIIFTFIFATIFAIFSSAIFPNFFKPIFYIPFLVISFFQASFIISLWLGCLSGFITDLLSSTHMGMHALIYTLCVMLFYRQKKYFKETPLNISIFTVLISFVYTLLNVVLLYVLEGGIKITFTWFLTDFIGMSLFDGIYAFIFFALPLKMIELLKKRKIFIEDEK